MNRFLKYSFISLFVLLSTYFNIVVIQYLSFNLLSIIIGISLACILATLLYLSYFDIKKMEVHNTVSFTLMSTLLVLNLGIFLFVKDTQGIWISENLFYNAYENLTGALFLGGIFLLIVLLTKEKALGQGDVRLAIISGMLVGFSNVILWTYLTIFSAFLFGLYIAIREKKFKGLKIPLVPFMVFGTIVVLLLQL